MDNVENEKNGSEKKSEKLSNLIEIVSALIIGISTILGAFSAYQSSLYDGMSNEDYNKAVATINAANSEYVYNNQIIMEDVMYWIQLNEYKALSENPNDSMSLRYKALAEQMEEEVPFELIQAIEWADEENAKNPYKERVVFYNYDNYIDNLNRYANKLMSKGNDIFTEGQNYNNLGDKQTLVTVVFAIVLFLGSMASIVKRNLIKVIFFTSTVLLFLYSTFQMFQVPFVF